MTSLAIGNRIAVMVTMDIYGHLFPSEQEALADALDGAFTRSQTDKRWTEPDKSGFA